MPPRSESAPDGTDLKECTRCGSAKSLSEISEVRLRVGGSAVFICRSCKKREEIAPLRLGYECPGWMYGREGYRCPRLRFDGILPPIQSLAGSYNVLFFAADQAFGPRYHRKTKGTLTLGTVEKVDRDESIVLGTVLMDRTMAISDTPWVDEFSFLQEATGTLTFSGFEDGACVPYRGIHRGGTSSTGSQPLLRGQLRVVRERFAARCRPDAKCGMKQPPITFGDMDEADKVMRKYESSIAPWICRNLSLPDLVAARICAFWRARPPPLFMFERGDLCLTTLWPRKGYMYDDVSTVLVARRRISGDL
mmetsp:Transcript_38718/g.78996  ORF Transcript_38718/g.78996 Transcript_38718/m.78996 type:complete len:307 (-) Transcript_38718:72-992(-)